MDSDQRLERLLEEIKDGQLREAERAKVRWTRLTIFFALVVLIALPAIWSYLHHLLVIWF